MLLAMTGLLGEVKIDRSAAKNPKRPKILPQAGRRSFGSLWRRSREGEVVGADP